MRHKIRAFGGAVVLVLALEAGVSGAPALAAAGQAGTLSTEGECGVGWQGTC